MKSTENDTLTARTLERMTDTAGAIADDVKSEANDRLREAAGLANDAYGQTRDKALETFERTDGFLRDRSLLVLGVVAGAALLAGFALRGGDRAASSKTGALRPVA
jgi:ElaB/YqjD/DUF883 family membrane-anchored ribosome-binding protein